MYRTQRRDPLLAVIRPLITPDGGHLTLTAPEAEPLHLRVDTSGTRQKVDLFGTAYQGIDQGDEAADWLSDRLGVPSRLVRTPPEHDRVTDGLTPGTSGYADSCALHVLSRSTLDLLNARMTVRRCPAPPRRPLPPQPRRRRLGRPPHGGPRAPPAHRHHGTGLRQARDPLRGHPGRPARRHPGGPGAPAHPRRLPPRHPGRRRLRHEVRGTPARQGGGGGRGGGHGVGRVRAVRAGRVTAARGPHAARPAGGPGASPPAPRG